MPASKGGKGALTPPSLQFEYEDDASSVVNETKEKPRPVRSSRDRGRNADSIWSVPEPEKRKKSSKPVKKSTKKISKDQQGENAENQGYLENPIYATSLQNWTLPRVELWCRDPNCKINLELWGDHQQHQDPYSLNSGQILSLPYKFVTQDHSDGSSTAFVKVHHPQDIPLTLSSLPEQPTMNSRKSSSHSGGGSGNMHMNMNLSTNHLNKKEGPLISKIDIGQSALKTMDVIPFTDSETTASNGNPSSSQESVATAKNNHPNNRGATDISGGNSTNSSTRSGANSAELDSAASTTTTGFESGSGTTTTSKSETSGKSLTRSERLSMIYAPTNNYPSLTYVQTTATNPFCPSCNGVVPLNHLEPIQEIASPKTENGFWNQFNHSHPLQRDHSFHSFGGFTLNGQYNTQVKKHKMVKFCSSHKIALVVSTFSLLVTIGLVITLLLMKKKGMMET